MAEEITESTIRDGPEDGADGIKNQETMPTGAGHPGQRRHDRVQSRNKLGQQEHRRAKPVEGFSGLAIGVTGVRQEAMNEVQDPVAVPPGGFVPDPVSQHTGSNDQGERRDGVHLVCGRQCPSRNDKKRSRYRKAYLIRK